MKLLTLRCTIAAVALLGLGACKGGGNGGSSAPPTVSPSPTPTPSQGPLSFEVDPCLIQLVTPGNTVAILYIPDTLKIDFTKPSTFPNGRTLADPVIDRTLAMLFLDLRKHSIDTFHNVPVNPLGNDVPLRSDFPYFAPPQGNPPLTPAGGTNFDFRTDAASAYVRVDRMGMPAVATALIGSSAKNPYNDDSPDVDFTYKWTPEIKTQLTNLTNALADDFDRLGVTKCAAPK